MTSGKFEKPAARRATGVDEDCRPRRRDSVRAALNSDLAGFTLAIECAIASVAERPSSGAKPVDAFLAGSAGIDAVVAWPVGPLRGAATPAGRKLLQRCRSAPGWFDVYVSLTTPALSH